ncbi:MAG: glycerophosphodiester phosphodiesterase [Pseudomonadaceae bacterium]|nr:glycerophosphodiester phosphodiesterase [Pseudomonadaceae bacterium]
MKTWLRYSVLPALCLAIASHASADGRGVLDTLTELGPRPYYLVEQMSDGPLKKELSACADRRGQFKPSIWSIGHRGAPLQFPEHTKESYEAAARMGAGILECDVTFTKDRELVCRHAQCDLHTTTNIVATPLAQKCTVPPQLDADGVLLNAADIRCCTSDITLAEFKSLDGKMDAANRSATSIDEYLDATAGFRTDLYTGGERGTLISHAESIELFRSLGVGMTPELKSPEVVMPYEGDYSQEDYAQQLLDEYRAANIPPFAVWPQSFNLGDVRYWIDTNPEFGKQAVFLDSRYGVDVNDPDAVAALEPNMQELADSGVKILAPPMFMMLGLDGSNEIIASDYALAARSAGLELIGWTTERSGQLENGGGGFYYSTVADAINNDGDILTVIDALAQKVGIIGLFSDWPATTTFYANCKPTAKARRR